MKRRVFSGIQPSGNIHVGNYLGAIQRWVDAQDDYDNLFCIVDLHAITVPQDPAKLRAKIRELAALYLASGIDPQKSTIFVQSRVPAHAELAWILNCAIPMGWLERMTQFKDKGGDNRERVSVGLFDYPALMAADILLYNTNFVPVGDDQTQHVELTRDVAERFNKLYGETFVVPQALIGKVGARIMGLDDSTKKMSKSDPGKYHAIGLLDAPDAIRAKITRATTDSERTIVFDEHRKGLYNLLVIYELLSKKPRQDIENEFAGKGYAEFKTALAELVIESLKPVQDRYQQLMSDHTELDAILARGAAAASEIATVTLAKAQKALGLG